VRHGNKKTKNTHDRTLATSFSLVVALSQIRRMRRSKQTKQPRKTPSVLRDRALRALKICRRNAFQLRIHIFDANGTGTHHQTSHASENMVSWSGNMRSPFSHRSVSSSHNFRRGGKRKGALPHGARLLINNRAMSPLHSAEERGLCCADPSLLSGAGVGEIAGGDHQR
jgi:hypothetical protein